MRAHHLGTRHLLGGTVGDGLTVSRTCLDACPGGWLGHCWVRGERAEYRLCIPDHYVLESQAANNARQARCQS